MMYAVHVIALVSVFVAMNQDLCSFQQFGYYRAPFFAWKRKNSFHAENLIYFIGLGLSLVSSAGSSVLPYEAPLGGIFGLWGQIAAAALLLLHLFFQHLIAKAYPPKKPLVYTGRVQRLDFSAAFLLIVSYALCHLLCTPACCLFLALAFPFSDLFVLAADVVNRPVELRINEHYYRDARKKIAAAPFLKVVAITGSYGKTSTKNVVASMLAPHFNTLSSPASYNTKLGLTRTIRESLIPTTEIFVAEMGAKRVGEIEEIVDFLPPDIALITSIGEQHLETFRSIENIIAEKSQVFKKLKLGGFAFINEEDPILSRITLRPDIRRVGYSFHSNSDFYLTDIVTTGKGSSCVLVDRKSGNRTRLLTTLLGRHNLLNILAGAAIATTLGVEPHEIAAIVSTLKPVKNRLSTRTDQGVLILEDAFNSNPVGAKAALDVLGSIPTDGRRIIMTPGMIELAQKEQEVHRQFGRQIASVCDHAILISEKQTRSIRDGLIESGFGESKIDTVPTMAEAFRVMREITRPGDLVLIENDLPDAFEEKK